MSNHVARQRTRTVPLLGALILLVALAMPHFLNASSDPHRTFGVASSESGAQVASIPGPSLGPSGSSVAMHPQSLAQASPSPNNPVKPEIPDTTTPKKTDAPIYAAYLKDPASLGFTPDANLFQTIYHQVKTQHVDLDPDDKLFAGVAKQVERLLKEAGIPATGVKELPKDRSLPGKVAELYGGKVNRGVLYYAMIRGLLEGTGDPYTVLMTPKEYHQLMEQMQNESFGGIGIYIELDRENHGQLTVVEPLEGTPAYEAGLLPGDQIVKINGKTTDGMSLDMATTNIRGPEGSPVVLTIRRKGTPSLKDYSILRAQIEVASVTHKMLAGNIGLVKLRLFGAKTGAELSDALSKLQSQGAKGIILDLRNNGGGYINAAIDVCSHFVQPGALVTYVTDKAGARRDYNALARAPVNVPVVLLVNGYSASASEITAGCLKDYKSAVLMGTKTFGKGSVQQLYPLPAGAALKLTVAHFFTPKGNKINKVGVQPDIKIEMEPRLVGRGDKDIQVQKALEWFRTKGPGTVK